jgi:hypothetical protein
MSVLSQSWWVQYLPAKSKSMGGCLHNTSTVATLFSSSRLISVIGEYIAKLNSIMRVIYGKGHTFFVHALLPTEGRRGHSAGSQKCQPSFEGASDLPVDFRARSGRNGYSGGFVAHCFCAPELLQIPRTNGQHHLWATPDWGADGGDRVGGGAEPGGAIEMGALRTK